ncbi:hypothetical protein [Aquitalea aquatica]|uniref:Uncharacterized protein n=1 Tax=Aquitalea aquatica TaxID=3044273 RepID=A0A838XZD4_9NEIS|nr:hypothetical protein [Aquitalea magnusonii]MBA4707756.1 hypothetical protein [Aquitalea magnusonii]
MTQEIDVAKGISSLQAATEAASHLASEEGKTSTHSQGDLMDALEIKGAELAAVVGQIARLGGDAECAKEAAKRLSEALYWADRAMGAFDGSV